MANKWTSKPPLGTQIIPSWRTDPQYLKLWLLFQEGGGGTAYDLSGNRNHGTLTNMANPPSATSGWTGKGLSFDGVNDYVGLGTPTSLMALTYPLTITAWVKPTSLANSGIIVSLDVTDSNSDIAFGFSTAANKLYLGRSTYQYGLENIDTLMTAGRWQHWTVVFTDTTHIYFYLDGVRRTLTNVNNYFSATLNNIGARNNGTALPFNGLIDDVRIYNRALTAEEVRELFVDPYGDFKSLTDYRYAGSAKSAKKTLLICSHYGREKPPLGVLPGPQHPLQKGIVGQWLMNEGGGRRIYDLSGNKNNGTITNMANPPTASSGWTGKGLSFDGVNDYVSVADNASLNIGTTDFTISVWTKSVALTNPLTIISKQVKSYNSNDDGWLLMIHTIANGRILTWYDQARGTAIGLGVYMNDNIWYHTVIVKKYSEGLIYVYRNGVFIQTVSSPASNINVAHTVRIGENGYLNQPFNGLINDVRIYNRALTAGEVMELYLQSYCMFPKTKISSQMFNTIPQVPRPLLDYGRQSIY